jgi:hypothetical protein
MKGGINMYVYSEYRKNDMGIQTMKTFNIPSLDFGIELALLSAATFVHEVRLNQLCEFIASDEFVKVIDDSFVGRTQLFTKDTKRGVRMDVYVEDRYKRVDIYSENKNRPFFIQICNLDNC